MKFLKKVKIISSPLQTASSLKLVCNWMKNKDILHDGDAQLLKDEITPPPQKKKNMLMSVDSLVVISLLKSHLWVGSAASTDKHF